MCHPRGRFREWFPGQDGAALGALVRRWIRVHSGLRRTHPVGDRTRLPGGDAPGTDAPPTLTLTLSVLTLYLCSLTVCSLILTLIGCPTRQEPHPTFLGRWSQPPWIARQSFGAKRPPTRHGSCKVRPPTSPPTHTLPLHIPEQETLGKAPIPMASSAWLPCPTDGSSQGDGTVWRCSGTPQASQNSSAAATRVSCMAS